MRKILAIVFGLFASTAQAESLYNFTFKGMDGSDMPFSQYEGKVVMVVNTASQCGLTPQYESLQQLYERFESKGFVIVGIPADDFGGQELETNDLVKKFVSEKYGVTFPMAGITKIRGEDAHPFYKWAGEQAGFFSRPKWNFHKYVFDRKGNFVGSFESTTSPTSNKVIGSIQTLIDEDI